MRISPTLLLTALEDRRTRLGTLAAFNTGEDPRPLPWTAVAAQCGTSPSTFSKLKNGSAPGGDTLPRILEWLNVTPEEVSECEECFAVVGATDLPVADRDHEWDGSGATTRVFEAFTDEDGTVDVDAVSRAFLLRRDDEDPQTQAAYGLGFADMVDGTLTMIPAGVFATAGGRGVDAVEGIDDDERDAIKTKICTLYGKIDDAPPCPFAEDDDDSDSDDEKSTQTAAIYGWGSLSNSESSETQEKVARVAELLSEGAVGVSIMHDLNPDDMPDQETIDALIEAEDFDGLEALFADVSARPRHVAIVDTPAFSDARLTLGDDGLSVEGPVTFEGTWTGDVRQLPYGVLTWDDDLLPIPIVIDHDGGAKEVVGSITKLERQDGVTAALRPLSVTDDDVSAVAAAAGGDVASALPARYFDPFRVSSAEPFHIDPPDERGLRRVWGTAAPRGVCHRSDMGACFTYPGDVDKQLRGFHTGSPVALDDGSTIRVGAITLGGRHIDTGLARRGVAASDVGRHRDDANTVFAMVRAWDTPHGLDVSGVAMPGVSEDDVMRALALAPSVELWPSGRGRTLVGVHLVPTPAWPVAASAGSAVTLTQEYTATGDPEAEAEITEEQVLDVAFDVAPITDSLARIEKALALLAASALTDVPVPTPDEE